MKIFGKTISEYVSFAKGFLILVLLVGLARLVLSLAGVANSVDKFLSLTVLMLIGLVTSRSECIRAVSAATNNYCRCWRCSG